LSRQRPRRPRRRHQHAFALSAVSVVLVVEEEVKEVLTSVAPLHLWTVGHFVSFVHVDAERIAEQSLQLDHNI
jgi:hypothetical protein